MSILRGQGRLARDALWQLMYRGLTAICVLIALWWGAGQPWEILAAQFLGGVVFVSSMIRLQRVRPILSVPLQVYKTALPMLWLNLVSTIYARAYMILLRLLDAPRSEIGYYGVAYRIMETIFLLATPIGLMLFRHFRLNESGKGFTLRRILLAAMVGGLLGLGVIGMCSLFGDYVIVAAFGQPFSPAAGLLIILAVSLSAAFAKGVLFQAAMAFGLERWCAIRTTAAAIVNVSANLLFLPRYGVVAAAWIMVVTETVIGVFVLYGLLVKRQNWETQLNECR